MVDIQQKGQKQRAKYTTQIINREQGKRMWYLIQRTVKYPRNTEIPIVKHILDGVEVPYNDKEG